MHPVSVRHISNVNHKLGRAMQKGVYICGQQSPRSDCAFAQSDQGLRLPLTETLDIVGNIDVQQRPFLDCISSMADLDLF